MGDGEGPKSIEVSRRRGYLGMNRHISLSAVDVFPYSSDAVGGVQPSRRQVAQHVRCMLLNGSLRGDRL